jgi:hypothetical protein
MCEGSGTFAVVGCAPDREARNVHAVHTSHTDRHHGAEGGGCACAVPWKNSGGWSRAFRVNLQPMRITIPFSAFDMSSKLGTRDLRLPSLAPPPPAPSHALICLNATHRCGYFIRVHAPPLIFLCRFRHRLMVPIPGVRSDRHPCLTVLKPAFCLCSHFLHCVHPA